MNQINLKNRTAIVTGGAQGFGLAITERFLESGANVIMWDIDEDTSGKVLKEKNNPKLSAAKIDVTNFDQISYAISGGCTIPDSRTEEFIWSRTALEYPYSNHVKVLKLLNTNGYSFSTSSTFHNDIIKCRCVR